jgi:hypothetical protein
MLFADLCTIVKNASADYYKKDLIINLQDCPSTAAQTRENRERKGMGNFFYHFWLLRA